MGWNDRESPESIISNGGSIWIHGISSKKFMG